jgi:hypothetical protein
VNSPELFTPPDPLAIDHVNPGCVPIAAPLTADQLGVAVPPAGDRPVIVGVAGAPFSVTVIPVTLNAVAPVLRESPSPLAAVPHS